MVKDVGGYLIFSAICSSGDNKKLKELHDKCEKELPPPTDAHPEQKVTPHVKTETAAAAAVPPPPPPKPKFVSSSEFCLIDLHL